MFSANNFSGFPTSSSSAFVGGTGAGGMLTTMLAPMPMPTTMPFCAATAAAFGTPIIKAPAMAFPSSDTVIGQQEQQQQMAMMAMGLNNNNLNNVNNPPLAAFHSSLLYPSSSPFLLAAPSSASGSAASAASSTAATPASAALSCCYSPALSFIGAPMAAKGTRKAKRVGPKGGQTAPKQQVGAEMRSNRPYWVKPEYCLICGHRAQYLNFGAHCCNACRMFFRRSVLNNKYFVCKHEGQCDIKTSAYSRCCRSCRFDACVLARFDISLIQFPSGYNVQALKQRLEERRRALKQAGREELLLMGGGGRHSTPDPIVLGGEMEAEEEEEQLQPIKQEITYLGGGNKYDDGTGGCGIEHFEPTTTTMGSRASTSSSTASSSASKQQQQKTQQLLKPQGNNNNQMMQQQMPMPSKMVLNNNNNNNGRSSSNTNNNNNKIIVNGGVENSSSSFTSIIELLELNKYLDQLLLAHRLGQRVRATPNNLLLEYLCAKALPEVLASQLNVLNFVELFTMNGAPLRNRDDDEQQLSQAGGAIPQCPPSIGNYLNIDTLLCIEQLRTLPRLQQLNADDSLRLFRHNIHKLVAFSQAYHTHLAGGIALDTVTHPNGAQPQLFGRERMETLLDGVLLKRLRKRAFCNVMDDVRAIQLSIEEFVLLRAVLFFTDVPEQMSPAGKRTCQAEAERLARALLRHQQQRLGPAGGAQRYAECLLFSGKIIHASRCQAKFYRLLLNGGNDSNNSNNGNGTPEALASQQQPQFCLQLPPFVVDCMLVPPPSSSLLAASGGEEAVATSC